MQNWEAKSQKCFLKDKYLNYNLNIIKKLLINTKKSVSIAESCTGGYLSYLFTFLPNSSKFFKGSIVSYSDEIKRDVLYVEKKFLKTYGAISKEVSIDMSKNVMKIFNTDFSISVTGNLGPTKSEEKEVGLIYATISSKNRNITKRFLLKGTREEIRKKISYNIIYLFKIFLKEEIQKI